MNLCVEPDLDDSEDALEECNSLANTDLLGGMVATYIDNYFKDKPVPEDVNLFSPKYIKMCLEMNICTAVDMAYEAMAKSGLFDSDSADNAIEPDVRLVIGILRRMKPLVPQEFSAGMLLMHLEILEGLTF
jgi:hypothetical protein